MKFRIKDEDGKDYTVEEIIEKETQDEDTETVESTTETTISLTEDEITSLKSLAAIADKLVALVKEDIKDEDTDEEEEIEEDDEEMVEDEDTEEVVETCEVKGKDSKYSFGSIEKRKSKFDDAFDVDADINAAWNKRLNGGIRNNGYDY